MHAVYEAILSLIIVTCRCSLIFFRRRHVAFSAETLPSPRLFRSIHTFTVFIAIAADFSMFRRCRHATMMLR